MDPAVVEGRKAVTRIEITPRAVIYAVLAVFLVWLFSRLWEVLLVVMVSLVLVGTLNPVVRRLEQRGMRRGIAITVVVGSMAIAAAALLLLTLPALFAQIADLAAQAPAIRQRGIEWLARSRRTEALSVWLSHADASPWIQRLARMALASSPRIAEIFALSVTAVFLAVYLIADRERSRALLFSIVPRRFHLRLARVLLHLETIVGGYVRGQLVTSAAMAVFVFVLLTIFHVRNAVAFAVFAGATDVLPFIGGLLGTVPAVAAALTVGVVPAVAVLVGMIIYQEFENRVLVPRVYGSVLRLSPATVIVALLAGGKLLGMIGAILSIPVAAALQMLIQELRVELPGDATDDAVIRTRDEQAEAIFAARTEGAAPGVSAAVAVEIAETIREADAEVLGDEAAAASVPVTSGDEDRESDKGPR